MKREIDRELAMARGKKRAQRRERLKETYGRRRSRVSQQGDGER
jgi:tmRNA-binding protein